MNSYRPPRTQHLPPLQVPASRPDGWPAAPMDRHRYRRVRRFFLKVLWRTFWWDVVWNLPILRWFHTSTVPRWQKTARQYRELATNLGGVLIKLGQFLSTRVDIFPPEVTVELAGLQDEVAPEPLADLIGAIEADCGCKLDDMFVQFSSEALGAASLGQAHEAVLLTGEKVVVKVLRSRIHALVETDLHAMRSACRWLVLMRHIRNRMDLNLLMEEFAATTRAEMDLLQEKENLKRFAADFEDNRHVYVPAIFEPYCNARMLTMENVAYIKIADTGAIRACGIDCARVADRLYDIYMHQIFITNFVHADPHPGNIYVRPLPTTQERSAGLKRFVPGMPVPFVRDRSFQLVFIDFGMTAVISERLKTAMRMGVIGLGTQDSHKIVQAYVVADALRPGTDLRLLEEAHREWLQKIWGLGLGKLHETALREARYFMRQYRDLILDMPFQMQADLLFIGRALGILVGLTTTIDPKFDPWTKAFEYSKRFTRQELKEEWQGVWEELFMLGKHAWSIPAHMEQVLARAKQGALTVQVSLSADTRKAIRRIDLSVKRFAWMVLTAALLISGVISGPDQAFGLSLIVLSILSFAWGMRKGP